MLQVFINSRSGFAVINLEKVVYLKADGNYTDFYFNDGKTKTHLSTLSSFLKDIEAAYADANVPSPFFRMGRSYIINTGVCVFGQHTKWCVDFRIRYHKANRFEQS